MRMRLMGFSVESLIGITVAIIWVVLVLRAPQHALEFTIGVGATIVALVFETIIRVHRVATTVQTIEGNVKRTTTELALRLGEALDANNQTVQEIERNVKSRTTELAVRLGEALDASNHDLYVLRFAVHTVSVSEINEVWHELLSGLRRRYIATNLTKREFVYDRAWGDAALDIQRAKLHYRQVSILKVFIIENGAEYDEWQDVWQKQADAGISLRYIVKSDVKQIKEKNDEWQTLETGFGVFDDRVALLWMTDDTRKNIGSKIVFRNQDIAAYDSFFRALYEKGTDFKKGKKPDKAWGLIEDQEP